MLALSVMVSAFQVKAVPAECFLVFCHNTVLTAVDLKLTGLPWESVIPVGSVNLMLLSPSVVSEGYKQGKVFPPGAFCHLSTPAACSDCFLRLES